MQDAVSTTANNIPAVCPVNPWFETRRFSFIWKASFAPDPRRRPMASPPTPCPPIQTTSTLLDLFGLFSIATVPPLAPLWRRTWEAYLPRCLALVMSSMRAAGVASLALLCSLSRLGQLHRLPGDLERAAATASHARCPCLHAEALCICILGLDCPSPFLLSFA